MILKRSVRIVKKVQVDDVWKFVSLARNGSRYVWDNRPGAYFLDWYEAGRRRREFAGHTPAQALQAQKRKRAEIAGALVLDENGTPTPPTQPMLSAPSPAEKPEETQTPILAATELFLAHVAAHSPDKPETVRRYRKVLQHFRRHLEHKQFVEAITRVDIDEYKIGRCQEKSERHDRVIRAPTVNFEVGMLRTFFYYWIDERGLDIDNPCARFKKLPDAKQKAGRRPPTYTQTELDAIFAHCDPFENAVFATLLLTGLRRRTLLLDVARRGSSVWNASGERRGQNRILAEGL